MAFTNLEVVRLRDSSGPALSTGDWVWVRYEGHLAPETAALHPGLPTQFDANYNFATFTEVAALVDPDSGLPLSYKPYFVLKLGTTSLIQGWTQGLVGLPLGSISEIRIPAALGYGATGAGASIPPNADLVFTVMPVAHIPAGQAPIEENIRVVSYTDLGVTPPVIVGISEDSGVVGDGITSDTTPTLAITATPGSTVLVWVNGLLAGAASEVEPGLYTYTTAELDEGEASVDVEVILDDVGQIRPLPDPASDLLLLTIDTTAPASPPTMALAADTGQSTSDRITSNGLITVSALEEGASWQYRTSSTGVWALGTGSGFTVAPGTYAAGELQVRQVDEAGNISPANTGFPAFTVDSTAPNPGVLSLLERTGNADNTFLLAVTGQDSGSTLAFERSLDGGATWAATTAQQNDVANGTYQYRAKVSDTAGNSATTAVVSAVVLAGFSPGPWTVQGVTLGTTPLGYALKAGNTPEIQVRLAGQVVSANYPGGGWQAIAAAASGSGYHLYWRNLVTSQIARWILNAAGVYTSGVLLPDVEVFGTETSLNVDLNGDGSTGVTFTPGPTNVGNLNLGSTQIGYALRNGTDQPIQVRFVGQFASQANPGAGWAAIAAAANGSAYTLYWKNSATNQVALWNLNAAGDLTSSALLSNAERLLAETSLNVDLDGDGSTGITFTPGPRTLGSINLGSTQIGYALRNGTDQPIQVRFVGQFASQANPGAGWAAIAAAANGSAYALYWKNSATNQYALWNLNAAGDLTSGALLSNAERLLAETSLNVDLDGDGSTGVTFTPGPRTLGSINLGTTQIGYALRNGGGTPIHIKIGTDFASQLFPGFGWVAIGAEAANAGFRVYWSNSSGQQFATWDVDAQGTYTGGSLLSTAEFKVREAQIRTDLNGDGRKGPFNEQAGSAGNDVLTGQPLTVTYGFAGDDQITAVGSLTDFDLQVGGTGSDHYVMGSGKGAFVLEQGNDAADQITAGGLRLQGGTSQWLTVEGKHLLAYSITTNSSMVVLNWEQAENRIETFNLADGTYSYAQVRSQLLTANPSMTNVTWSQIASAPVHAIFKDVGFGSGSSVDSLLNVFAGVSGAGAL